MKNFRSSFSNAANINRQKVNWSGKYSSAIVPKSNATPIAANACNMKDHKLCIPTTKTCCGIFFLMTVNESAKYGIHPINNEILYAL